MNLSDEDAKKLAEHLVASMRASKQAWWVEPEAHAEHHAWLSRQIAREVKREQLWVKVQMTVLGAVTLAVLGFIGWALGSVGKLVWIEFLKAVGRAQS